MSKNIIHRYLCGLDSAEWNTFELIKVLNQSIEIVNNDLDLQYLKKYYIEVLNEFSCEGAQDIKETIDVILQHECVQDILVINNCKCEYSSSPLSSQTTKDKQRCGL